MKTQKVFITSLFATVLLLSAMTVAGQGRDNPMRDHPGMPSDMPDTPKGHAPMFGRQGYRGVGDHMTIEGNISIAESINISLTATPSTEMESMMEDHGMSGRHEEMEHTMSVLITEIVEFRDLNGDGFTDDDVVVSSFTLNSSTLGEVQFTNESGIITYKVSTLDNSTFSLILEVNGSSPLPNEWKWSYEIDYPFTETSTKLAILHTIHTFQGNLVADQHRMDRIARFTHMNNSQVVANHSMLPMLFTWDRTALVDEVETDVEATGNNGTIALAFQQGSSIFYDPKLTIEEETIQNFEQSLATLFSQDNFLEFAETLGLPNLTALVSAGISVVLIASIILIKKK